jgi:hypothetical protein
MHIISSKAADRRRNERREIHEERRNKVYAVMTTKLSSVSTSSKRQTGKLWYPNKINKRCMRFCGLIYISQKERKRNMQHPMFVQKNACQRHDMLKTPS